MDLSRKSLGQWGEGRVARRYEAAGYRVVSRNWRGSCGELDLVAVRGSDIVFCEVKTRSSRRFGSPAEAVDWRKQRRIRQLATEWLREHETGGLLRFDVAEVVGSEIGVLEAAF